MRFMVRWWVHKEKREEVLRLFASMELEDYKAGSGPDVKIVGRWHDLLGLTGMVVGEADTAEALAKWFIPWQSAVDFEILPAMTDEEAHAVAREMMLKGF